MKPAHSLLPLYSKNNYAASLFAKYHSSKNAIVTRTSGKRQVAHSAASKPQIIDIRVMTAHCE